MSTIMNDVMIDLETLSTDSNAVVVSISAVWFNRYTGELGKEFEVGVNLEEQVKNEAIMDVDTVMWWLEQSKEAQNELTKLYRTRVTTALSELNTFLSPVPSGLWGNGATFDNVILRNLYKRHAIDFQVPFWADRCVRTYVDDNNIHTKEFEFTGIKHKGIDDCKHQIKYMTKAK